MNRLASRASQYGFSSLVGGSRWGVSWQAKILRRKKACWQPTFQQLAPLGVPASTPCLEFEAKDHRGAQGMAIEGGGEQTVAPGPSVRAQIGGAQASALHEECDIPRERPRIQGSVYEAALAYQQDPPSGQQGC